MRTRHLAVGLVLAAVALLAVTVIFSPSFGAGSTSLSSIPAPAATTASPSHRAASQPTGHHPKGPIGPSARQSATVSPSSTRSAGPSAKPSARPTGSGSPSRPATTATPTKKPTADPNVPKVVKPPKPVKPGSRGVVYLTFDDGPGPYTPAVLKILRDSGSTATFFQMGNHIQQYPTLARQVRAQGNAIGNHTYDHADLTKLSAAKLRAELARGPAARCVRPPYGATNAKVRAAIRRIGAREVLWSVDTLDWTRPGAGRIVERASGAAVHNRSIVLMHDGGGDRSQTVLALPVVIKNLQLRGYVVRKLPGC